MDPQSTTTRNRDSRFAPRYDPFLGCGWGERMANEEHLAILLRGVDEWNVWRAQNPDIVPELAGADLSGLDLSGINLHIADLQSTILSGAHLRRADLRWTDLEGADLSLTDMRKAGLRNSNLRFADLYAANLDEADLNEARLNGACVLEAKLRGAHFETTDLTGANLSQANLQNASLYMADISEANFTQVHMFRTAFFHVQARGTNFDRAIFSETILVNMDLSHCIGLDKGIYYGHSVIDHKTLMLSRQLPISFLRGFGLADNMIEYLPSILGQPIEFYSCFISYSSKDRTFAERLHADLQAKGVRCWFAPHNMPIGAKILDTIDEAIRLRDKVLLVLSESAIASDWVEGEVTRALDEERECKHTILFPIRLDDAVLTTREPWARLLWGQRNIGNFTAWKEHDAYKMAFDQLLRDLQVEAA